MIISIFTPTFNRSELLYNLYISLKNQTNKSFEWIIVDDGSIDNTEEVVKSFINENELQIQYIKVKNGGKHRAINLVTNYCRGEFIFIVDNDDTLIPEAIQIGLEYIKKIDEKCAGVVFRLMYKDGTLVGDKLPFQEKECSYFDIRYKLGYNVDFKEFTRVSILKDYKYPDFEGEKFCSEALVWNRISEKFNFLFIDKPIYICEYLVGGLSSNIIINRRKSSNYAIELYRDLIFSEKVPIMIKIKSIINFWRFAFFNKQPFLKKWGLINFSFFGLILIPLAFVVILLDYMKIYKII